MQLAARSPSAFTQCLLFHSAGHCLPRGRWTPPLPSKQGPPPQLFLRLLLPVGQRCGGLIDALYQLYHRLIRAALWRQREIARPAARWEHRQSAQRSTSPRGRQRRCRWLGLSSPRGLPLRRCTSGQRPVPPWRTASTRAHMRRRPTHGYFTVQSRLSQCQAPTFPGVNFPCRSKSLPSVGGAAHGGAQRRCGHGGGPAPLAARRLDPRTHRPSGLQAGPAPHP